MNKENLQKIEAEEPVHVMSPDGKEIVRTVYVKVPAWQDPETDEVYLDETAQEILDRAKKQEEAK